MAKPGSSWKTSEVHPGGKFWSVARREYDHDQLCLMPCRCDADAQVDQRVYLLFSRKSSALSNWQSFLQTGLVWFTHHGFQSVVNDGTEFLKLIIQNTLKAMMRTELETLRSARCPLLLPPCNPVFQNMMTNGFDSLTPMAVLRATTISPAVQNDYNSNIWNDSAIRQA